MYIEFNTGGLFYGWSTNDTSRVDRNATEDKLVSILRGICPNATIVIKWEDGNDKILAGKGDHPDYVDTVKQEINYFPWYNPDTWCVFSS